MSASLTEPRISAFAQGTAKKLLIGGEWVPARSGRTFSTKNPSSGTVLTEIAPALAAGCTLVLKPAEEAPLGPLRLAELDLPPGVVNVVTGYGETAGAAVTTHPDVNKIGFTGSTETGQAIVRAAAGTMKRVHLELGGKSPDIVFADANLEAAVAGASMGVFANNGQVCCAGTRIFVEKPIYEEFVARFSEAARRLQVGDAMDADTEIGPASRRACGPTTSAGRTTWSRRCRPGWYGSTATARWTRPCPSAATR